MVRGTLVRQLLRTLVRHAQHCLEAQASPLAATDRGADLTTDLVPDSGTGPVRAPSLTSDRMASPADMFASIHSVLTVLGVPAPRWREMAPRDLARWLIALELQLEDEIEMLPSGCGLLAEQHPPYSHLQVRRAGRRLRFLCADRLDDALNQLHGSTHGMIGGDRAGALSTMLETGGRLRLLKVAMSAVFEHEDCRALAVQTEALMVLAQREMSTVRLVNRCPWPEPEPGDESFSADQLLRELCLLLTKGLRGAQEAP